MPGYWCNKYTIYARVSEQGLENILLFYMGFHLTSIGNYVLPWEIISDKSLLYAYNKKYTTNIINKCVLKLMSISSVKII